MERGHRRRRLLRTDGKGRGACVWEETAGTVRGQVMLGSGGYGRASRGVRAVQGHKSLAWAWAQSQRAHLEGCGQGGPTAWGKTSGILQTLARRRLGLKASSKPISFQGVTEFLSLPLFMRLCDCVRKAPSIKLSPRLDRLLILLMCEFKHVSWRLKNGKNTLKSNKD